ncbi:MAG: response regulator [Myxococcaceae bacterium]
MATREKPTGSPGNKPDSLPSTVLVVDDEEVVRDVLHRALSKRNIPHELAATGGEAIEKLSRGRFGCVVTDKNLPDMSGVDVLKEAQKLQPFCARIMITGYTTPESILEVLRMGASDYLEKPFNDMQLVLQRINSAMEHQRTEFERNTLVEVLTGMHDALKARDKQVFEQKTELDMLQSVVEFRIEEATSELRAKLSATDQQSRADREIARSVLQRLDELLIYVGDRIGEATANEDPSRAVLREVEDRVKSAVTLLRDTLQSA